MQKTYFNWSSGKDSALALYHLMNDPAYKIERLLTSVNAHHDRVSMHGLRRSLLEAQVEAIGLPCTTLELPETPSMGQYNQLMKEAMQKLKTDGFTVSAFGDIFLEDLRVYREEKLALHDIKAVFPLWKRDTTELIHEFLDLGFKTIVVTVDASKLDRSFAGRIVDENFLRDLPDGVDPCGENGEFHTFCFDGPIFSSPISFEIGETVYREYPAPTKDEKPYGFWFCDLLPR